jgi:hypothetical protein
MSNPHFLGPQIRFLKPKKILQEFFYLGKNFLPLFAVRLGAASFPQLDILSTDTKLKTQEYHLGEGVGVGLSYSYGINLSFMKGKGQGISEYGRYLS